MIDHHRLPPMQVVQEFMRIGGQKTNIFDAQQATLYVGLVLEEVAEMLRTLQAGSVDTLGRSRYTILISDLKALSSEMKQGFHMGDVLRCTHTNLLDDAFDVSWVAMGLMLSVSISASAAWREGARSNLAKFPNGVAKRDANGKIQKPEGWKPPNFLPYVQQMNDERT
jgi:predicted HAD superfamily Cof-like phosphohydrolase